MSLDGRKTKGALFGYAMAVAGDLNRDGFPGRIKTLNACTFNLTCSMWPDFETPLKIFRGVRHTCLELLKD